MSNPNPANTTEAEPQLQTWLDAQRERREAKKAEIQRKLDEKNAANQRETEAEEKLHAFLQGHPQLLTPEAVECLHENNFPASVGMTFFSKIAEAHPEVLKIPAIIHGLAAVLKNNDEDRESALANSIAILNQLQEYGLAGSKPIRERLEYKRRSNRAVDDDSLFAFIGRGAPDFLYQIGDPDVCAPFSALLATLHEGGVLNEKILFHVFSFLPDRAVRETNILDLKAASKALEALSERGDLTEGLATAVLRAYNFISLDILNPDSLLEKEYPLLKALMQSVEEPKALLNCFDLCRTIYSAVDRSLDALAGREFSFDISDEEKQQKQASMQKEFAEIAEPLRRIVGNDLNAWAHVEKGLSEMGKAKDVERKRREDLNTREWLASIEMGKAIDLERKSRKDLNAQEWLASVKSFINHLAEADLTECATVAQEKGITPREAAIDAYLHPVSTKVSEKRSLLQRVLGWRRSSAPELAKAGKGEDKDLTPQQ